MDSHRYVRSRISNRTDSTNSRISDLYNGVSSSPQGVPDEYWTNGSTILYWSGGTLSPIGSSSISPSETFSSEVSRFDTTYRLANGTMSTNAQNKEYDSGSTPENHISDNNSPTMMKGNKASAVPSSSNMSQHQEQRSSPVRSSLIAGSCAGIASTIGLYPMDVLRTKMQQSKGHGPWHAFRTTIQHGGIKALYTGITMPLLAQTVYKGTIFTISNITQQFLVDHRSYENRKLGIMEDSKLTTMDRFWGGFIGGAVNAALFVTPVEFVRNQMIAQHTRIASGETVIRQTLGTSSWDVVRFSIQQERGILSLWRGTSWAVYRDSIGCGFFFLTMAYSQQSLTTPGEKPSFLTTVVSGGLAGLAFWVSVLPLDTIKTWVQSSDVASSPLDVSKKIRKIHAEDGMSEVARRLLRGWQLAYARGIPSAAITMTSYSLVYRFLSGTDSFV